jgi:hypothetical protein
MRAEQRIGRLRFHPASVREATHDGRPRRPVERAVSVRESSDILHQRQARADRVSD